MSDTPSVASSPLPPLTGTMSPVGSSTTPSSTSTTTSTSASGDSSAAATAALSGAMDKINSSLNNAEVQGFLARLKQRQWVKTLRSPQLFAHPNHFSRPRNTTEATQRLESNLPFFLTNYLIICGIILIVTILSRPSLIFLLFVLLLLWLYVSRLEELKIGAVTLKEKSKMAAFSMFSALTIFIFAGTTIFMLLGVCSCVVVGHALFHTLPPVDGTVEETELLAV